MRRAGQLVRRAEGKSGPINKLYGVERDTTTKKNLVYSCLGWSLETGHIIGHFYIQTNDVDAPVDFSVEPYPNRSLFSRGGHEWFTHGYHGSRWHTGRTGLQALKGTPLFLQIFKVAMV